MKKSDRVTNSGKIFSRILPDRGIMLELTCETDFVARNSHVPSSWDEALLDKVAAQNLNGSDGGAAPDGEGDHRDDQGEHAAAPDRRPCRSRPTRPWWNTSTTTGSGSCSASPSGTRRRRTIPRVKEIMFDCALHAAAFAPLFLSKDKVSPAFLKEQEEIFTKQAENLGKPANVLQGIIKGKVAKMLSEICLLEQPFVKDDKRKVSKVLEELSKEAGHEDRASSDYTYMKLGGE